MLRGYYSAASGILVQQRNLNVIGNNITTASTVGYRAQRVIQSTFDQEVVSRYENGKYTTIGTGSQTNVVDTVETNFNESSIYETENPFDMAIISEGFFNVSGDNGQTFLTRNGCFNIDAQGYLVLDGIGRVQGENGDIYIGGSDFSMDSLGNIYDINGNFAGKLRITIPAEEAQTIKMENGLFVTDNVTDVEVPKVINYGYERSNVDMNDEYTRLIEAQAAFKACSTALSMIDQMNGKAVTSIASVN